MPVRADSSTETPLTEPSVEWPACLWRVRLLGGLVLEQDSQRLTRLPSRAATALLARLALWPERDHSREELVELLWPGVEADVGRNRLRQTLSVLKSQLEPHGQVGRAVIAADRQHLRVAPQALVCDVGLFEQALQRGDEAAARHWYRGDLLPGLYDEWINDERLRLTALADRLKAVPPPAGDAPVTATANRPAPARAPLPAQPVSHLPLYLTTAFGLDQAANDLAHSLQSQRLVCLFGPGGSGKTRLAVEVARRLGNPAGLPAAADRGWVPAWTVFASMIQCHGEAEMLDRLLITLRLDAADSSPMALIRQALACGDVLLILDNLEQAAGPAAGLVTELLGSLPRLRVIATSRRVLGVDGEHLWPVAPLPMPRANASLDELKANPAMALFVDRARERRSDFHLGPLNAPQIADLVHLLEGHPLAIELAAARIRSVPPAQWIGLIGEARERLAPPTADALALLSRQGPRGVADARHASMLQVIDASWRLLTPAQQSLLCALTVFDGGCDAAAARTVGLPDGSLAATTLLLDELVSCSMLRVMESSADDGSSAPRFAPYEPVYEFAATQADAAQRALWRQRHRAWLAATAVADGPTADLARLRADLPNLLLGLASAVHDGQVNEAWAIVWSHRRALADLNLPATGLASLERALALTTHAGQRLVGHAILGAQSYESGLHQRALGHALAVQAILGEPDGQGWRKKWAGTGPEPDAHVDPSLPEAALLAVWAQGWALRVRLRVGAPLEEDDPWLQGALRVCESRSVPAIQPHHPPDTLADWDSARARLLTVQGSLSLRLRRDYAGTEPSRRQSLSLWMRSGDRLRANEGRVALAICLGFQRRLEEQLQLLQTSEHEARELGQIRLACFSLSVRGYCLCDLRRHAEAGEAFRTCLREARAAMAWRELFYGLWNLPRVLAHLRQPEAAARIMGFAEAFYADRFGQLGAEDLYEARRTRRLICRQISESACAVAWSKGAGTSIEDILRLALGHGEP